MQVLYTPQHKLKVVEGKGDEPSEQDERWSKKHERGGGREKLCVCVKERESVCVCVREREK